jgi:hypothetical protein
MIKIQLNELLTSYLKKEFKSITNEITLTRNHPIGRFICSMIKYNRDPPAGQIGNLTLIIPDIDVIHTEIYNQYLRAEDYRAIIDFIQSSFDNKIDSYFIAGYRLKLRQKDIIESFMNMYDVQLTTANYEMLKKRDFRKRKQVLKAISEMIEKC